MTDTLILSLTARLYRLKGTLSTTLIGGNGHPTVPPGRPLGRRRRDTPQDVAASNGRLPLAMIVHPTDCSQKDCDVGMTEWLSTA